MRYDLVDDRAKMGVGIEACERGGHALRRLREALVAHHAFHGVTDLRWRDRRRAQEHPRSRVAHRGGREELVDVRRDILKIKSIFP